MLGGSDGSRTAWEKAGRHECVRPRGDARRSESQRRGDLMDWEHLVQSETVVAWTSPASALTPLPARRRRPQRHRQRGKQRGLGAARCDPAARRCRQAPARRNSGMHDDRATLDAALCHRRDRRHRHRWDPLPLGHLRAQLRDPLRRRHAEWHSDDPQRCHHRGRWRPRSRTRRGFRRPPRRTGGHGVSRARRPGEMPRDTKRRPTRRTAFLSRDPRVRSETQRRRSLLHDRQHGWRSCEGDARQEVVL